jgi:hypothetical protein
MEGARQCLSLSNMKLLKRLRDRSQFFKGQGFG